MKKIIFVCTGNTCRSPMAEIILKSKLKQVGITDIRVSSAGLNAVNGQKMSENSAYALKQMGLKPYAFRSKQLTEDMIKKATLVLCMTNEHKQYLKKFSNVYTLSEAVGVNDIFDPYGCDKKVYVETSKSIANACDKIINELLKVLGG